mmetsp:Transcript_167849/g.539090  ORF Transcript_167849/g.539090 Transcript_167849/m.539090 type:complete len:409 (+) Transcript_167849:691-1917(+)
MSSAAKLRTNKRQSPMCITLAFARDHSKTALSPRTKPRSCRLKTSPAAKHSCGRAACPSFARACEVMHRSCTCHCVKSRSCNSAKAASVHRSAAHPGREQAQSKRLMSLSVNLLIFCVICSQSTSAAASSKMLIFVSALAVSERSWTLKSPARKRMACANSEAIGCNTVACSCGNKAHAAATLPINLAMSCVDAKCNCGATAAAASVSTCAETGSLQRQGPPERGAKCMTFAKECRNSAMSRMLVLPPAPRCAAAASASPRNAEAPSICGSSRDLCHSAVATRDTSRRQRKAYGLSQQYAATQQKNCGSSQPSFAAADANSATSRPPHCGSRHQAKAHKDIIASWSPSLASCAAAMPSSAPSTRSSEASAARRATRKREAAALVLEASCALRSASTGARKPDCCWCCC